LKTLQSSTNTR